MTRVRLIRLVASVFVASLATLSSFSGVAFALTSSSGSDIGVIVDQPPTTLPPPPAPTTTTLPPEPSAPPSITTPTTEPSTTTTLADTPPTTTTDQSLVQALPDPEPVADAGFIAKVKSAARTTKELVKGIASGKPVADVAERVLPAPVANVVVPAVRTASTFVFPIGLLFAVVAYLVLQQRVDATDPKLTAAPLAHDDDVVKFT